MKGRKSKFKSVANRMQDLSLLKSLYSERSDDIYENIFDDIGINKKDFVDEKCHME
jgi:hypothetical protein